MSYYMNADLTAYSRLMTNYDGELETWNTLDAALQAQYDSALATYQDAHDAWLIDPTDPNDPTGPDLPEPQPPERQPSPPKSVPPAAPGTTYDAVLVDVVTQIATSTGQALVQPGRYVVTPSDGSGVFALSVEELAADYTDTTVPLPT